MKIERVLEFQKKRSSSLWSVRVFIYLTSLDSWAPKRPLFGPLRRWTLSWTAGHAGSPVAVLGTLLGVVDHARFSLSGDWLSVCRRQRVALALCQPRLYWLAFPPFCPVPGDAFNAPQVTVASFRCGLALFTLWLG
ncbi:hypothetical protein Nepgr_031448 [Nepenthes gracilis]|uniref:Uncharacterized protein n=1 Tax=Nepenthes gracilis TaxID=150966 RepID=A0AAD3THE0_NEPGR|nr:hypothetical protein Nepgr_031448 [Nepenthes gracilis]